MDEDIIYFLNVTLFRPYAVVLVKNILPFMIFSILKCQLYRYKTVNLFQNSDKSLLASYIPIHLKFWLFTSYWICNNYPLCTLSLSLAAFPPSPTHHFQKFYSTFNKASNLSFSSTLLSHLLQLINFKIQFIQFHL